MPETGSNISPHKKQSIQDGQKAVSFFIKGNASRLIVPQTRGKASVSNGSGLSGAFQGGKKQAGQGKSGIKQS